MDDVERFLDQTERELRRLAFPTYKVNKLMELARKGATAMAKLQKSNVSAVSDVMLRD